MIERETMKLPMRGKRWVFTGGGADGGFGVNGIFRNAAGLFEEVIRWTARVDGDVSTRENFVFNTARAGYSIRGILDEFDERVARYRPAAVAYISGPEDRRLPPRELREGLDLLERRTESLGASLFVLSDQLGDSIAQANRLLEMIGAEALPSFDRDRLELVPTDETFPCSGTLKLADRPMRWLFIGDSITHGALHTYGYDSLPQLWEKYLRGDLNRKDDVVLNAGVSNATATEQLERLDIRYTPYSDADVVIAMFGTNDCCYPGTITVEHFRDQMRAIVDMARDHGSQVVLRTPQPQKPEAAGRVKAIVPFVEAVREVAREKNTLLVDHFASFTAVQQANPARFTALMSDPVHPNAQGQHRMFREMAYALDMVRESPGNLSAVHRKPRDRYSSST